MGSSFGYQDVSQHHDATGASFNFILDVHGDITGSTPRDQEVVVPIGYLSGATPTYNQQPAPTSVPDRKTAHEVLRDRGRQGIKNAEIEPGFEDL